MYRQILQGSVSCPSLFNILMTEKVTILTDNTPLKHAIKHQTQQKQQYSRIRIDYNCMPSR